MSKKRLYTHVLLDRSGSMETCRDSTISAVNEYVGTLAANDALSSRVSLTIFDSQSIDLIRNGVKPHDFIRLNRDSYQPRGMTPLNDAIGKTVAKIDAETRREGEGVSFVILTDGLENCSTEYNKEAVKQLLEGRRKDKNWLVIFLGANQDAFTEGAARGTVAANTMNFSAANVGASMKAASRASMSYAHLGSAAAAGVDFTDAERAAALAPDDEEAKKKKGNAAPEAAA